LVLTVLLLVCSKVSGSLVTSAGHQGWEPTRAQSSEPGAGGEEGVGGTRGAEGGARGVIGVARGFPGVAKGVLGAGELVEVGLPLRLFSGEEGEADVLLPGPEKYFVLLFYTIYYFVFTCRPSY